MNPMPFTESRSAAATLVIAAVVAGVPFGTAFRTHFRPLSNAFEATEAARVFSFRVESVGDGPVAATRFAMDYVLNLATRRRMAEPVTGTIPAELYPY